MNATAKRYFSEHGVEPVLAERFGVIASGSTIHYSCHDAQGRFVRSRDLDAERKATRQPKRRRLDLCYFGPPPEARARTTDLLICEGEPDALAALQAQRVAPERWAILFSFRLRVAFLPGTATPARKVIAEVKRLQPREVFLAFDNDHAGDAAAGRILEASGAESLYRRVSIPEPHNDLAEALAASTGNRGDRLLQLLDAST